jgi:hypothetical protein
LEAFLFRGAAQHCHLLGSDQIIRSASKRCKSFPLLPFPFFLV